MTRKRAATKQAAGGQTHEIGSAVDLGITVSVYGPHARFSPARSDHGIARGAHAMRPSGPDTWTTEH